MNPSRDPGLQAERTALSWSRTGWAMLANALLALREGWHAQPAAGSLLGCTLLIAAAAMGLYGCRRRKQLLNMNKWTAVPALAFSSVSIATFIACIVSIA
ncbi:DUF202 domain-containing protein [Pseudomonas sp. KU43P]|uniref:DUF202 domain-containing protein n=1 Tax=Pseudomonas sp. KU43P TaxID=2487887 RepID=UPI002954666E|nr:DUF202 domain-containing protein [Pseudomonas sp. KU43P]